jgi:hypothetical protein
VDAVTPGAVLRVLHAAHTPRDRWHDVVIVCNRSGTAAVQLRAEVVRQLERRDRTTAWLLEREFSELGAGEVLVLTWTSMAPEVVRVRIAKDEAP